MEKPLFEVRKYDKDGMIASWESESMQEMIQKYYEEERVTLYRLEEEPPDKVLAEKDEDTENFYSNHVKAEVKQLEKEQIDNAIQNAKMAFWDEIVKAFPKIDTGDIEPLVLNRFDTVIRETVETWYNGNRKP